MASQQVRPAFEAMDPLPKDLVTVGIIHYDDYDFLEACFRGLSQQSRISFKTLLVDNTLPERRRSIVPPPGLNVKILVNAVNNGYAGAANQVIGESKTPFVFLMNPDVNLEPGCLEVLLRLALSNPSYGIWGPKLLREPGILDSAGHDFVRSRRFRDRGMGERDENQYPTGDIFAICGAAILLRREMLEDIRIRDEYFDEDFFVYHEDTDLCWRAWHRGWKVRYVPDAVGFHLRGWRQDNRHKVPSRVRIQGFKNHYLELIKNETLGSFVKDLPYICTQEILRLLHAVSREPALWMAYWKVLLVFPKTWRKRREIMGRRDSEQFQKMLGERARRKA
ncbi:MAG: glycosyltransferase family 2 protein [Elusimicrobia bacterium]|nr:glycosyltransferase family 2 protein [Elusimicrobiota bacterium]